MIPYWLNFHNKFLLVQNYQFSLLVPDFWQYKIEVDIQ